MNQALRHFLIFGICSTHRAEMRIGFWWGNITERDQFIDEHAQHPTLQNLRIAVVFLGFTQQQTINCKQKIRYGVKRPSDSSGCQCLASQCKSRFRYDNRLCGVCGRLRGNSTGLSPSTSFSPANYRSTNVPYSFICFLGRVQ